MAGGRPRVPTGLKLLRGNPGHRKLPAGEPRLPSELPTPPAHLSDSERRAWSDVAAPLVRMRVLTAVDGVLLETAAIELATYREAAAHIREHGFILKTKRGVEFMSPWLGARNTAQKKLFAILAVCGMTPADRSKVTALPEDEGKNAFGQF